MTGPGYDPTFLSMLPIVGPEIAHRSGSAADGNKAEPCPLWRLTCAALYFNPDDPSHAADKSPGLRALLENSSGHGISTIDSLLQRRNLVVKIEDYRDPALIAAVVTLGGRFNQDNMRRLDLFGEHPALVRSRLGGLDSTDAAPEGTRHHVLLAPAAPWPDQIGVNGRELRVPPMRLVAGRIPLLLELSPVLIRTLRGDLATGQLFGDLPAFPANAELLAADLTPDGIELRLGLPDPVADLAQTPPRPGLSRARLQPLRGKDSAQQTKLGLALVDPINDGRMDQAFAGAFAKLRREGAPLRADYDRRPEVTPIWWPLLTQRDANSHPVLTFRDEDNDKDTWQAEMRGDVFRMRLITGRAEGTFTDAVASANITEDATLKLERTAAGTKLELTSSDAFNDNDVEAEAAWQLTGDRFVLVSASLHGKSKKNEPKPEPLKVHAALYEAADRLGARYSARGLLRPGQSLAPHLFLPIVEGVAQIKTPEQPKLGTLVAAPTPAGGSVAGSVVLELPRKKQKVKGKEKDTASARLEIDAVAGHKITLSWPRRDPMAPETQATVSSVNVSLSGLRGVVRNLMWLAEESPDADHALPTGRINPAATGPMPLYLGTGVESDATLKLDWKGPATAEEDPKLAWTAVLTGTDVATGTKATPPTIRIWTRHPRLPLISSAEMLRSGGAAAEPSATRDLFPSVLEGELVLRGAPGSFLPSIYPPDDTHPARNPRVQSLWRPGPEATSVVTGTQWGAPEITLVAPSAPGLEFRQARDPQGGFTDGFTFETSLRLDLPGLDELFAAATPPRPARPEAEIDGAPTPPADPPATALDLDLLETVLWRRREYAQAMTRTVAARATQWFSLDDSAPEVHGLVEPWTAPGKVEFHEYWSGALAQAPLGGWSVTWPSPATGTAPAEEPFVGDLAIAGLGGAESVRFDLVGDGLVRRNDGPIRITGFAAALFRDAEAERDVDGAGLTLQRRAETSTWPSGLDAAATDRAWRAAAVRNVGMVGAERRLVTFSEPVKVSLTKDGEELRFWIRDLPLERGDGAWRFDAAQAAPERALGADPALLDRENAAAAIYEWRLHAANGDGWGFELNGLYLRPLRLLSVQDEGFKTLCAVDLSGVPKASNAQFSDDRPYRSGNLVRLDFSWTATGATLDAVTRVRLEAGAVKVSEATLKKSEAPLRFPVDYLHKVKDSKTVAVQRTATRERADLLILPKDGKLPLADGDLQAALRLRLFGRLIRVDGGSVESAPNAEGKSVLRLSFGLADKDAPAEFGASLQQMVLELPARRGAVGTLSMMFSVGVPLRIPEAAAAAKAPEALLIERRSDGTLTWLAADVSVDGETPMPQVDHARGVLHFRATERDSGDPSWKPQDQIEPVRGCVYLAPQYEILLDMVFPLQEDDEQTPGQPLPLTFVPQALNASGRLIAGAGHVGASLRTEMRTEMRTVPNQIVDAHMMLDLPRDGFEPAEDGWLESGVVWPVEGLVLPDPPRRRREGDPHTLGRVQRFETRPDPLALEHKVRPALTGWRVPLDALGKVDGPGAKIGVVRRIDVLAPVEHRLTPKSGGEPLTFATLDRITLLDASKIAKLANDMLEVEQVGTTRLLPHGFAPRYTHSDMRSLDPADHAKQINRTPHAGVARPSIAGGGFRDLKLLEDLKDADGGGGLLVFGAAPLALLPAKHEDEGVKPARDTLSFGAPWVTASDWTKAPAALKSLQQFNAVSGWVASEVDLYPFRFELAPNAGGRAPRLLSDPPHRAADLLGALKVAVPHDLQGDSSDPGDPRTAKAWTATEVLEPALFDAEERGAEANAPVTPLPSEGIPLKEWPLFLRALVGLQAILRQPGGAKAVVGERVLTLLRPGDGNSLGGLAAVRFVATAPTVPVAKSPEADSLIKDFFADGALAELVVYSPEGSRRTAPQTETGALPGAEAARSAALRDAAEALSFRPRVIQVERRDADGFRLSRAVAEPGHEAAELGARAVKLRDRAETVYASIALGWPQTPFGMSDPGDLTLDAGPDAPILSAEAGLSARVADFGLRPKAASKDAPSLWFVSSSRSRFLRLRDDVGPVLGAAVAPVPRHLGAAVAPVPRHMTAPSVRIRAPGNAALRAALDKVAGASAFAESAPIMPAGLLRGTLGRRPGVMEIGYDALMTDRGGPLRDDEDPFSDLLDAEVPQSGVSATLGPGILRMLRRPRSTALPRGVPFNRRRRTFVSGADRRADGAWRESLVLEGTHVAMRKPEDAGDRRLLAELLTATLDDVLADGNIQVRMSLAVESGDAAEKIMRFLAETGFFAKIAGGSPKEDHASLGTRLVAGDLRIAFDRVECTIVGETMTLVFGLNPRNVEALAERARAEAADLRIALQLSSGAKGSAFDVPSPSGKLSVKLVAEGGGSKGKGKLPEADDMLELAILAAPLNRPRLPYATRTAIFGDPAYDRSLASRPQSAERAVKVKSAGTETEAVHTFLFGLDRASHDLGSAINLAAGEVNRASRPHKWEPATGWTFELSVQRQPYDPSAPIPPQARPLRHAGDLENNQLDEQGNVWYEFDPQRRYSIPIASLYESVRKDGTWNLGPPAPLRPGDRLVLRVRVSRGTNRVVLRADTLLTAEPSVGPPDAVYSLLDVIGEKESLRARVSLHAPGPMPRRVEFPDFLGDLLVGHIRRRALFIWHEVDFAPSPGTTRHATLVKFDRSGGGQLPRHPSDFEPPLEPSAEGGGGS